MWAEMDLPMIPERIIAFSIPEEDTLLIRTQSGLHE